MVDTFRRLYNNIKGKFAAVERKSSGEKTEGMNVSRREFLKMLGVLGTGVVVGYVLGETGAIEDIAEYLLPESGLEKALNRSKYAIASIEDVETNGKDYNVEIGMAVSNKGVYVSNGRNNIIKIPDYLGVKDSNGKSATIYDLLNWAKRLSWNMYMFGERLRMEGNNLVDGEVIYMLTLPNVGIDDLLNYLLNGEYAVITSSQYNNGLWAARGNKSIIIETDQNSIQNGIDAVNVAGRIIGLSPNNPYINNPGVYGVAIPVMIYLPQNVQESTVTIDGNVYPIYNIQNPIVAIMMFPNYGKGYELFDSKY